MRGSRRLRKHLPPAPEPDPKPLQGLIDDLGSDRFAVRGAVPSSAVPVGAVDPGAVEDLVVQAAAVDPEDVEDLVV